MTAIRNDHSARRALGVRVRPPDNHIKLETREGPTVLLVAAKYGGPASTIARQRRPVKQRFLAASCSAMRPPRGTPCRASDAAGGTSDDDRGQLREAAFRQQSPVVDGDAEAGSTPTTRRRGFTPSIISSRLSASSALARARADPEIAPSTAAGLESCSGASRISAIPTATIPPVPTRCCGRAALPTP